MRFTPLLLVALSLLAAARPQAQPASPVVLDHPSPSVAPHFSVSTLPGTVSFETVIQEGEGTFRPAPDGVPVERGGLTAAWGRLALQAPSERSSSWILSVAAHEAVVYVVHPSGVVDTLRTGWSVPLVQRDVQRGSPPSVRLDLEPGAAYVLYVHLQFDSRLFGRPTRAMELQVEELDAAYLHWKHRDFAQGLFFGLLLALALYNLFLFQTFGDRSYLYYIGFIVSGGFYWLVREGYDLDFFWPSTHQVASDFNAIPLLFTIVFYAQFARSFLMTRRLAPGIDRLMVGLMVLWAANIALGFVWEWTYVVPIAAGLALFCVSSVFAAGIVSWRSGFAPAKTYLLAAAPLLVSCFVFSLRWLGIPDYSLIVYSFQIGMAAEALLLAMALVHRVRTLRQARAQAIKEKDEAELERRTAEHANRALQEADAFKTQLIGIAAHDLRSPLTSILGFAEIIEDEASEGSEFQEFAGVIQHDARHMLTLINGLLETAALESGKIRIDRVPVDLAVLVQDVAESYRGASAEKNQSISIRPGPDACWVSADADRMRDVLDNLISNAVKYTPPGGQIAVRASCQDGNVRVEVQDSGPGLTVEDRTRLFKHFQRLSARPTGGETSTGLGLAIARQLVELHGGTIGVETALGAGSCFWVELPTLTLEPATAVLT